MVTISGCAALTNPVRDGIPASEVPEELLAKPIDNTSPLPLTFLGQSKPSAYHLAPGDTLGVWIEGVLSSPTQGPPVYVPPGRSKTGPALGYPIPVREDGTIALPLVPPISVLDLTVTEAEEAIRRTYVTTAKVLQPGAARIIVTLLRRREYHVVVFRDEAQNYNIPGTEGPSVTIAATQKRGNGHALDLPAGENDVLNALAHSGGPPGLDDYNEVIVDHATHGSVGSYVVRIPLAIRPGQELPFMPKDIILDDGDSVYLQQRDVERFYTGGLLPPGEYVLPRNYDLDVIAAIAYVKGPLLNGAFGPFGGAGVGGATQVGAGFTGAAFGGATIAGTTVYPGIGGPSPRLLTIVRKIPGGGQICIKVDLQCAFCDPKERILIKAGDLLVLQETPAQAITRYLAEFIDKFTFNFGFQKISSGSINTGTGVVRPPGLVTP